MAEPQAPKNEPAAAGTPPQPAPEAPGGETQPAAAPSAEAAGEKPAAPRVVEPRPTEREPAAPSGPMPPPIQPKTYIWGTGRRKSSVARVRIRPGGGLFLINKREADQYFNHERDRQAIGAPLRAVKMVKRWDVWANVVGGGYTGQAGAVMLGLARALAKAMPELEAALRDEGLLTRDARMIERKKPGQPGARKRFQFSKR
jgi:small subunit ribosomal protein S9